jgi:16S rRNA (cytosine1402-N4)-methyltransferase
VRRLAGGLPMSEPATFSHRPVMVDRVVDVLAAAPAGTFVDATVGGGGHAAAVLAAAPHLGLVGIDRDADAVAAARDRLAPFGDRVRLVHARFDEIAGVVDGPVAAVLFDLGVSSPQLDVAERGFSYRADAPLDMRMDRREPLTAAEIVNGWDGAELARLLRDLGDERHAGRIARAIVAARPIATTGRLADVVRDAVPAAARRRGGHPARRTFQALCIAVDRELEVLPVALDAALDLLAPGGRCAVLAYHSGEDRIVKERFRTAATGGCTCPPGLPCACGAEPEFRLLRRGAWMPAAEEVEANHRAESARLRAVERLAP